ncbi:hypothetical protein K7X08_023349 [Anisodus acutangulus]|uniref:non-specific serine/threonine protein kinase n=1 Tax=Anisodus acutangulus TaxID=402998 RepID=A0A9Q1LF25_9SOLA|nr:hypothetical protein K7X08_023349 [Anisodus acutangulus]
MERYELGRLLGQGTFAKVYYARNIRTAQGVAIKVIDKEKVLRVGLMNQIKREISVMRLVRHPNIVHLYEVMATKTKIYFSMEYAKGGELFNKVAKGKLKEDVARKYFQQLINAVDFCHSRGVYHRDLKPENLLLDENENLKISDFGLSALVESKHQDGLLHTTCETPTYVAPEVISRKGYDGAKADIWSCGVVLFVLLAGYLLFQDSNLMEMYRKIGKAEFKCPSWFPPEAKWLLPRMLDPNPSTRITLAKIRGSSWFKRGISIPSNSTIVDETSTDLQNTKDKQEVAVAAAWIPKLNAFDIISLYAKFDLSKLFEEPCLKKEAKFTSWKPASAIISKLEDIAKRLKLKVSKKDEGLLRFEGTKEGKKGTLCIDVEIFEVVEAFHLVEVKKSNGDTLEYQQILNECLRPGLQDIVWTWQDDQQPQQSQDEQPNSQLQQQQRLDNQQQFPEQQQQQQQLQGSPVH